MHTHHLHYLPLAPLFFLGLLVVLGLLIALIQIGVLGYAYQKMGVSRNYVYALLVASLVGSYINIPVAELHGGRQIVTKEFDYYGITYQVPVVEEEPGTVLAVNVGGAIIPTVLSIYLLVKNQLYVRALIGVAVVTAVVHMMAQPIPEKGIAVPIFIPPLVAAIVAVALSRKSAAPLAYICGCLGTLIGADLLYLGRLAELGAPVASIGGAGTFDGVFLTGILAVLLAW